jgi:hypothetical protein
MLQLAHVPWAQMVRKLVFLQGCGSPCFARHKQSTHSWPLLAQALQEREAEVASIDANARQAAAAAAAAAKEAEAAAQRQKACDLSGS